MRRMIICLVAVAVLLIGCSNEPEEVTETPTNVTVDTGLDLVSAEGVVSPVRTARLSVLQNGPVVELLVEEGDDVSAGDPILRLDSLDQEIAFQQATAGVIQADANVESAMSGLMTAQAALEAARIGVTAAEVELALAIADPSAEQIAINEASIAAAEAGVSAASGNQAVVLEAATGDALASAQAELVAAQTRAKNAQDALGGAINAEADEEVIRNLELQYNAALAGVNAAQAAIDELLAGATAAERQAAFGGVSSAQADAAAAQAQLDLLLAGAKPEQVRIAEVGVEQAEASLIEAELAVENAEAAVSQAEAGLAQAETAVSSAQQALDDRTLTAPFGGTIASIDIEVGEIASAGLPLVTMADYSSWIVRTTDLTELDVVEVGVGFPVDVQIDALPNERLSGTVTEIATQSVLSRGDVTYEVTIALEDADSFPIRWGMTAFVDVDVEQ